MSSRETAVNVLVGTLLLFAFAVPVIACVAALGLVFYSINAAVHRFLPAVGAAEDVMLFGIICLSCAGAGVRYFRKSLWPNAFLSFAVIAVPLASWYGADHRLDAPWSLTLPMLLLFTIPADRSLRRWEYVLLGAFLAAGIVLNVGLLGQGALPRVVADCSYLGMLTWMSVQLRRGEFGRLGANAPLQSNS